MFVKLFITQSDATEETTFSSGVGFFETLSDLQEITVDLVVTGTLESKLLGSLFV